MRWAAAFLLLLSLVAPLQARTLKVGPEAEFKAPSAAARVAEDGDTVEIAPGEYYDCAVWSVGRLLITGPADPATPAVLTDVACQGKAAFVVAGSDVTIRHLTFARVRVPDGNGAGIRAEGRNLTVETSRFVNNEAGILMGDMPDGTLNIADSQFEANGVCRDGRCSGTLQTGRLLRLRIERSAFTVGRAGALVNAAAQRTDIVGSRFADGPRGTTTALVTLSGGAVVMADNIFERGPQGESREAAVLVRDLWGAGAGLLFQRNTLTNDTGARAVLVHNVSSGTVRTDGNHVAPGDTTLDDSGLWTARARDIARSAWYTVRDMLGWIKRGVRRLLPF